MLKKVRLAALAAALLIVAAGVALPPASQAQTPPAPPAAPAATPAPAAPAAPAAKAPELIDNPYGLEALWKGGDLVAKTTLAILVLMSIGSWYIIVTKVYEQHRMGSQAKDANKKFWKAPSIRQGAEVLKKSSPYRFIAETGLEATNKHEGLISNVDLNDWITMSIQRAVENVQSRTQGGLAFLASVGSTAPFVGLFGTVWGIYHALIAIGVAGQAVHRQGGRPGRRSAHHDRHWPRRRGAGGARLQLAHPPEQGVDGRLTRLLRGAWTPRSSRTPGNLAKGVTAWHERSLRATGDGDEVVSTINTTPLVDVMLVLLIIFLITIPVVTTSIPVQLPKERNEIRETKPENIVLSVDVKGGIFWNDLRISSTAALIDRPEEDRGARSAAGDPDPRRRRRELRFRGPHHLRRTTGRHRQGGLHHRAARARRQLTPEREEFQIWQ